MYKVGYIYQIDKGDYDWVFILSNKRIKEDEVKKIILEKYNDYFKEIYVIENELYINKDLSQYNIYDNVISDMEHWPIVNLGNFDLEEIKKYGITKELKRYKIKMPTTDKNIWEIYEDKWNHISSSIFGYNGALTYVCEECLDEAIEFLQMVKKEWKERK